MSVDRDITLILNIHICFLLIIVQLHNLTYSKMKRYLLKKYSVTEDAKATEPIKSKFLHQTLLLIMYPKELKVQEACLHSLESIHLP